MILILHRFFFWHLFLRLLQFVFLIFCPFKHLLGEDYFLCVKTLWLRFDSPKDRNISRWIKVSIFAWHFKCQLSWLWPAPLAGQAEFLTPQEKPLTLFFQLLLHVSGCESEPWDSGGSSSKCCSYFCTKGSIPLLFFMLRFYCFLMQIGFHSGGWGWRWGGTAPKMWDGICVRL